MKTCAALRGQNGTGSWWETFYVLQNWNRSSRGPHKITSHARAPLLRTCFSLLGLLVMAGGWGAVYLLPHTEAGRQKKLCVSPFSDVPEWGSRLYASCCGRLLCCSTSCFSMPTCNERNLNLQMVRTGGTHGTGGSGLQS